MNVTEALGVFIPIVAILVTFVGLVWRSHSALARRMDEGFRAARNDRNEDRAETRTDLRESAPRPRDNFNTVNQNIEKLAAQVGSHAERVATVEGYITVVSDR